jgi:hypothetical protein
MHLAYKDDWEETKARLLLWWNHEYFGRCALAVTAPRDNRSKIAPPPEAQSPQQKWYDLDWISRDMEYRLSTTFYGGEAFPIWNAGYSGVTAIPALLGCPTEVDMETGWWHPILAEPEKIDFGRLHIDQASPLYQFTIDMLQRAVEETQGKSLPSIGAFGGCGDTLAALRGNLPLLIDCLERPEQVMAAEEYLMDMWFEFYDRCYGIIRQAAEGSTCWFPLWSPGKFYAIQNDFSYNIGPAMFRKMFLPVIRRQTEFLDHCVYHVDGKNAFRHVNALCELPRLQALQILPGAGQPSPLYFMDVLKKVQAAGKNLHISIPAGEVKAALGQLSARGLLISTSVETEAEARALLHLAEKLSVDRG